MMRKILFLALLLGIGLGSTAMAAIVDDFSSSVDFLTATYPQGIWEGYIVNGGVTAPQDGSINTLYTSSGVLHFDTTLTNWEGSDDDGAFLYTMTSGDFRITTKISNGQFESMNGTEVDYLTAGLMARSATAADIDYVYFNAFDRYYWSCNFQLRSSNGGWVDYYHGNFGSSADADRVGMTPWMRLERSGDEFIASTSANGLDWTPVLYDTRADMPSSLQVGLAHAIFSENSGWVEFEFFKVANNVVDLSGTPIVNEKNETSATVTVDLTGPVHTAQVDVIITPDIGSEPNDIRLDGVAGPLTLSFPVGTSQQTFEVEAIDDDLQEGPEFIHLLVDVFSTDTNYDGNYGSTIVVQVVDNEPGVLTDNGNGVLVDENGTLSDTFDVVLTTKPKWDVTVDISTDGQTSVDPPSLTFDDTDWDTPQTVTVTAVDDENLETDPHTGTISFTVISSDNNYDGVNVLDVPVTILENECGAWSYARPDANLDCIVDLSDLAELVSQWMQCTTPYAEGCIDAR